MIKLIATDLDGTLLRSDKTVSAYTQSVIDRVRNDGILFTLCTGRMYDSARRYIKALKLTTPVILYNGAMILDPVTDRVLFRRPLENDVAAEILQMARREGLYSQIYLTDPDSIDALYCREFTRESAGYERNTGTRAREMHCDLWNCLNDAVQTTKIIVMMPAERAAASLQAMRKRFEGRAEVTISDPEYMEFLHPSVNKGQALAFLAGHLSVRKEEILAFGDSYNDLSLLQAAGTGIAVQNACEALLQAADGICAANNADGAAHYLESLRKEPKGGEAQWRK